MKNSVNEAVRSGLINQMKSTCASDLRMLSGFLTEDELQQFISDVSSKLYVESKS